MCTDVVEDVDIPAVYFIGKGISTPFSPLLPNVRSSLEVNISFRIVVQPGSLGERDV